MKFMYSSKLKFLVKENYLFFILLPLLINFLFNTFGQKENLIFVYIENKLFLISLILTSFFYYMISKNINEAFQLKSLSISLCYFLSSFYLIEFLFFPITDYSEVTILIYKFSFINLYFFGLGAWLVALLYRKISFKNIFTLLSSYVLMLFFNNHFYSKISNLTNYIEINSDVPAQWIKIADLIYNQGLFHAYTNNVIRGQGLYLNYIQTIIFRINFPLENFQFVRLNGNLLLIFSLFLFIDFKISKKNKVLISLIFITLILNSDWLTYLFADSLMLEGLVSLFFGIFIINTKNYLNPKLNIKSLIFYLFFGLILFSKQFIATLAFLYLVYIFIFKKNRNVVGSFFIFGVEKFYSNRYLPEDIEFAYLGGRSFRDLFFDILNFNNIELGIAVSIFEEFSRDRITTLIFIIFLIVNLSNILKKQSWIESSAFYLVLLNIVFVVILYISWWKNMEIQSSFRYILNSLHLVIISLAYKTESLKS